MKQASGLLSWVRGGGVVVHVYPEGQDWPLPADAVVLPSFHVTLIGRKAFLELEDAMADVWDSARTSLTELPQPELDTRVDLATDADRKTWYLHVVNQDEFRACAQKLTRTLDQLLSERTGSRFPNPETDRYFHMTVANNQGGDPLKSIGSIRPVKDV